MSIEATQLEINSIESDLTDLMTAYAPHIAAAYEVGKGLFALVERWEALPYADLKAIQYHRNPGQMADVGFYLNCLERCLSEIERIWPTATAAAETSKAARDAERKSNGWKLPFNYGRDNW
jgi:hypothetical protein